jgi:hypothetical protein
MYGFFFREKMYYRLGCRINFCIGYTTSYTTRYNQLNHHRLYSSHSSILSTISSSLTSFKSLFSRNKSILKDTCLWLILASLAIDLKKEKRNMTIAVAAANGTAGTASGMAGSRTGTNPDTKSITPADGIY